MRMEDDRLVKNVVLGWMEDLEEVDKVPGRKRKTVLYYKRLVKEAGMDYTRIGMLTSQRKEWKRSVNKRMKHLERWERQRGNKNQEERIERSNRMEETNDLKCDWEGCNRICKTKAGLAVHRKRVHEISNQKVIFNCDKCNKKFQQEANLLNHYPKCGGVTASVETRRCPKCNKEISRKNISRHINGCNRGEIGVAPQERTNAPARVYVPKNEPCSNCRRMLSSTNMARHQRKCRPGGEAEL
jgi:hypothetical protein